MTRLRTFAALAVGLALLGVDRPRGLGDVQEVRHWSYPDYTRVVVELTRPVGEPDVHRLAAADGRRERLYVDLGGIWVGRRFAEPIPVGDGLLHAIRLGQNTLHRTRLVIDLESYDRHRLLRLSSPPRVVVDVYGSRVPPAGEAPRLAPELRPVRTVVIDPGHGGRDPGAIGVDGLQEKDVTLRLARALVPPLEARGFQVVTTRQDDRSVSLEERTALAEGAGGDVFISLHANAARRGSAHGIETYYLDPSHERHTLRVAALESGVATRQLDDFQRALAELRASAVSEQSAALAGDVHRTLLDGLRVDWRNVSDLGVKPGPFYVLFLSGMPAILLETGFLTHRGEARRLEDPRYLERSAERIAEGIARYRARRGVRLAGGRAMTARPEAEAFIPELPPDLADAEGDVRVSAGVRDYLAAVRAHLEVLHRGGASGSMVNHGHADLVDRGVRRLARVAEGLYHARGGSQESAIAIAAVGGTGRREMAIHSDVDLLFLYESELNAHGEAVAKRVQLWLWDANVAVGGAVRSLDETVALGREDASVCTALLDARFLSGDTKLFQRFSDRLRGELVDDPEAFIRARAQASEERHTKYGESLYLLQPNVKEGAGGLRDFHGAWWAASAIEPSLRSVEDLLHVGLLSEGEMDDFGAALDFLWRARNEMHLLAGRKTDQLSFELQEKVAANLGFEGGEGELPVEHFMGQYYRHARVIRSLSEAVISQSLGRATPDVVRPETREAEDGFRLAPDHLEIPHRAHLRQRPVRLLTAFAVAQEHQVPLSRTALRLVRENLDLMDDELRSDPEAAATLLRILDAEHRVMRSLMAMNECGLLGRYLPEWEHIVCRWQHIVHHTYTVDVHSIFLVEELRRLWRGKYEKAHPELTELVRSVTDRPVLFLGALLHDIGKGRGGDHSNKGEVLARRCLERIGLEPERVERAAFLVKQHLWMSHVAQRRDLADPKVIVEMARLVGDRENLRNLYLVTFADIRACSPTSWTEWKGQLLRELYERSAEFLESGRDDPERALEQINARVETRRERARRELQDLGVADSKIASFFEMMPRRYFVAHSPRQIARHALVALAYDGERPFGLSVREMRGGFTELILCAKDLPGLYARVAGSLSAANVNILGSHVYTTRTGLALEVYRVTTPEGGEEEKRLAWKRLEETLVQVLGEGRPVAELLERRRRSLSRSKLPSQTPPSVAISNDESDFYTIVDVAADDRLGLLHDLVRTLTEHGLEIYTSKASTILDQVADTFYVKDAGRRKLTDPEAVARLQHDLFLVTSQEPDDG